MVLDFLENLVLEYLDFLGVAPKQAISILLVPIVLDLTWTITKAVVLPLYELYRKIKPYGFKKPSFQVSPW